MKRVKTKTKVLSFLLAAVMVLGLMLPMSQVVYAASPVTNLTGDGNTAKWDAEDSAHEHSYDAAVLNDVAVAAATEPEEAEEPKGEKIATESSETKKAPALKSAAGTEHTIRIGSNVELKHGKVGIHWYDTEPEDDVWYSSADVPVQGVEVERKYIEGENNPFYVMFWPDSGYQVSSRSVRIEGDEIEGFESLINHWAASAREGDVYPPSGKGDYIILINVSFKPVDGKREVVVGSRKTLSNGKIKIENSDGSSPKEFTQKGDYLVDKGSTYKLFFIGNEGYEADEIKVVIYSSDDGSETDVDLTYNSENDYYTITVPSDRTDDYQILIDATFKETILPATYAVTVNGGSGSGEYAEGESVTITANEPETGMQFKEWTGTDGLSFTDGDVTTATATFTMPAQAVTVTATYENIPVTTYAVTVTYDSAGGNVYVEKEEAAAGETVFIRTEHYSTYTLGSVTVTDADGSPVSVTPVDNDDGLYTFVMPASAVTVAVDFNEITVNAVVDFGAGHEAFVQSRFGGTYAVDGAKVTVPIPEFGTHTVMLAWESLENKLQDVLGERPIDNGERLYQYLGRKSMSEYESEEDLAEDKWLVAREEAFQSGYVFTALWEQPVRNATITVTPPACGTEVHYEYKTGIYVWSVPQPQLSVSDPCTFMDYQIFYNNWNLSDYDVHGIGDGSLVMTGGNAYKASGYLDARFGYYIDRAIITVQVVGGTLLYFGDGWTGFDISVPVEHDIPDDAVRVEPNCTEAGSISYHCDGCGQDVVDPIEALGHDWGDWVETTAPTCTEKGVQERTCKHDASHKQTGEIAIDSDAHDWNDWAVTKPATAKENGEETRTCKHDPSHKETRDIPKPDAVPESIEISGTFKTEYVEGDQFDPAGMVVTAKYSDGTEKTLLAGEYTITPAGALTTDNTEITVSYTDGDVTKTATLAITVTAVTPPAPTTYTVTFKDGETTISTDTVNDGDKVEKPADPTKEGFTFDGWYADAAFSAEFDFDAAITEDTTVYAKWTEESTTPDTPDTPVKEKYKISYDLNGGTLDGKTGTVILEVEDGTTITLPTPTREGYTFDYWEGSRYEAGASYTVEGDHTFTAQWKADVKPAEPEEDDTVPKTGDGIIILLVTLMVVSLVGAAVVFETRKRYAGKHSK